MAVKAAPRPGDVVTARRLGWDEELNAVQEFDLEPYAEHGYTSADLHGRLDIVNAPGLTAYLVGGQEADPKTIRPSEGQQVKAAAGPCKPGERSDLTHCTPAQGIGAAGRGDSTRPPSGPSRRPPPPRDWNKVVAGKVRAGVSRLVAAWKGAPAAMREVGRKVFNYGWEEIEPRNQERLRKAWAVVRWVEHKMMAGFRGAQKLAEATAREKGLNEAQAARLAKILGSVDQVMTWSGASFVAGLAAGGPVAGKVASYVPLASLGYLAYSTARNPAATLRAAHNLITGRKPTGRKRKPKRGTRKPAARRPRSPIPQTPPRHNF